MQKTAVHTADTKEFEKGGGIFVPSSFSRIGADEKEKLSALDGKERIKAIIEDCFGIDDLASRFIIDSSLVEIEENVFVLELEHANLFEPALQKYRPLIIAATVCSAYIELEAKGSVRLFLPYVDGTLALGAMLATKIGVQIELYLAADNKNIRECESSCDGLKDLFPDRNEINLMKVERDDIGDAIRNFSDYDDYVFGMTSAKAAAMFGYADEMDDETTLSIIASVDSPMDNAMEIADMLGVKAKDETDAKRKLENLFAIDQE